MIIAVFTQYVTFYSYRPVRELAQTSKAGSALNATFSLALGYMSTVVPVILIAAISFVSNYFIGYYGLSLAALCYPIYL